MFDMNKQDCCQIIKAVSQCHLETAFIMGIPAFSELKTGI